jgi:hypothetical protein
VNGSIVTKEAHDRNDETIAASLAIFQGSGFLLKVGQGKHFITHIHQVFEVA